MKLRLHKSITHQLHQSLFITMLICCYLVKSFMARKLNNIQGNKVVKYKELLMSCYKHDMLEQQVGEE